MGPCRWLVPVSLNSIGAAYATSLLLRGRPGISTRREAHAFALHEGQGHIRPEQTTGVEARSALGWQDCDRAGRLKLRLTSFSVALGKAFIVGQFGALQYRSKLR